MKTFQLIFRLLKGFAVGAMIGLFFNPGKSSNIRKPILNKGRNFADEMKGKIGCTMESSIK